jgi:hypothetical protein
VGGGEADGSFRQRSHHIVGGIAPKRKTHKGRVRSLSESQSPAVVSTRYKRVLRKVS